METLHGKLIDMKDVLDKKVQSHMKQAEKNRSSEKWCNYHLGAAYGYNAAKEELEQLIRHHNWGQETYNNN